MHAKIVDTANAQHIFALLRAEHASPVVVDDEEVVEWEQSDDDAKRHSCTNTAT